MDEHMVSVVEMRHVEMSFNDDATTHIILDAIGQQLSTYTSRTQTPFSQMSEGSQGA